MSTTTAPTATASRGGRGRGGSRGGYRGGAGGRGGGSQHRNVASAVPQESPELAALRQKYGEELPLVQAVFPDWDEESILAALSEAAGQAEVAITRIAEGQAEQWGAVKSKKQSSKPASSSVNPAVPAVVAAAQVVVDLEAEPGTTPAAISHPPTRGGGFVGRGGAGRGRGDGFRGGRGGFRGGFRGGPPSGPGGRGGFRPQTNGHSAAAPTTDGWGNAATTTTTDAPAQSTTAVAEPIKPQPPKPTGPSWAGIASGAAKKPVVAVARAPVPTESAVTITSTDVTASDEGITSTKVEVTEGVSGWETTAVTETEVSENPITGDLEVEEVKVVETSVPETTASTTNGWGDVEPAAAVAVAAPAKPASRTIQPGTKMSWAQIARPPQPKPAPAPVSAPAPPAATLAEASAVAAAAPEVVEEVVVVVPTTDESTPLLADEQSAPEISVQAVSTDPWASTPVAAMGAPEPSALPVGEGWADAVIAQDAAPVDVAQHQRAEQAVPPLGSDPAGPLDVHTPAADALPTQQSAFEQPSALTSQQSEVPAAGPPGLGKRSTQPKNRDAAVIMPGSTPDVDKVGVQFGSLNLFGSIDGAPSAEQPQQQQQEQASAPQQQQPQSLYETSVPQQQPAQIEQPQVQQQQQQYPQYSQQQAVATQTDPTPSGQYQQAHQQQQHVPASLYGGGTSSAFGGFGGLPQAQPQQQQQPAASAYGNRYPQSSYPQQAQQQHSDTFSPFGTSSPYATQPLGGLAGLGGAADSISPYFSSQQAALQQQQTQQQPGVAPSPVPASVRDTATPVHQQQQQQHAPSAYGAFGQQQYGQPSQGYPSEYNSLYNLQQQDPMRNLGFYNHQYEQQAQSRPGTTEDVASKLGGGSAAGAGLGQQQPQAQQAAPQQAAQQQQQPYQPNMMGYGGYGGYYNPYHQMQHNPYGGPHSHMASAYAQGYGPPQAPYYSGYGAAGAGVGPRAGQQQQQQGQQQGQQQPAQQQQGMYGAQNAYGRAPGANAAQQQQGGYGGVGGGGIPHPSAYGAQAYGSFDTQQQGQQRGGQAQQQQGQQTAQQNNASKDVFGDRFFGNPY